MSITVENVSRHFGAFRALDDVSLNVPAGELVALLGPSGSGKTTLLRIIAGLEQPDAGRILFHDADVAVAPPGERGVGFVFQHYALFPHMSVFENVAFGLRVRPRRARPGNEHITRKVMELLELVHLDGMARRFPAQLSGGQRQRVALARALAIEPRVLLLDEPFGALDAKVRAELRGWLRRLHDELHVTSVFVTHDQEEALEVADRVVVMNGGRIEQVGTPDDVFHRPATEFVLSFIGQVNRFHGWVGAGCIEIDDISFPLPGAEASDAPASIFIRPHELRIEPAAHHGIGATVRYINTAGPLARLELDTDRNGRLLVDLPLDSVGELELKRGMRVHVAPENVRYFPQRA